MGLYLSKGGIRANSVGRGLPVFQAVPYVVCTWKGQSAFRFGALEFTASVGLVPSECMLLRFSALHVVEDHKESKYPKIWGFP